MGKVDDSSLACVIDEEVSRKDVTMQDTDSMDSLQGRNKRFTRGAKHN